MASAFLKGLPYLMNSSNLPTVFFILFITIELPENSAAVKNNLTCKSGRTQELLMKTDNHN